MLFRSRRIKVILSNLVSNAIKYQDKKKEERYSKVAIRNNNGNAHIIIEDNGIGISEKDTEKIFEMFYRATSLSKGSGLGLYIVKETIDKLNGSIEITSELNKGSLFSVHIPNFAS